MKTKYSACPGEASPWISYEILRASGIEGYKWTCVLCSHNFLQTRNRRLIKKAGIRSCSVRYQSCCRRDCNYPYNCSINVLVYPHLLPYNVTRSPIMVPQQPTMGYRNPGPLLMVIYFGKHVWCKKAWGVTLNNNITSFMIYMQVPRNLAWCNAPRVSLKVSGKYLG